MAKFYRCSRCGNLVHMVEDKGVTPVCCGLPMTLLTANTTDAAGEKHLPVVTPLDKQIKVTVSTVEHPMTPEHHISWIFVETKQGNLLKYLPVDQKAEAVFDVAIEDVVAVYEYCNLHGLWKTEV